MTDGFLVRRAMGLGPMPVCFPTCCSAHHTQLFSLGLPAAMTASMPPAHSGPPPPRLPTAPAGLPHLLAGHHCVEGAAGAHLHLQRAQDGGQPRTRAHQGKRSSRLAAGASVLNDWMAVVCSLQWRLRAAATASPHRFLPVVQAGGECRCLMDFWAQKCLEEIAEAEAEGLVRRRRQWLAPRGQQGRTKDSVWSA